MPCVPLDPHWLRDRGPDAQDPHTPSAADQVTIAGRSQNVQPAWQQPPDAGARTSLPGVRSASSEGV